jgi:hypothetical protein
LTIKPDGDSMTLAFNGLDLPLEHVNYDTFEATYELFDVRLPVQFVLDFEGNVTGAVTPLEPNVPVIRFQRAPERTMTDRAFLEIFAGTYEVMGLALHIALKGETTLWAQVQGQPEIELEPYKGTKFTMKGLTGFSIEFVADDTGKVTKAMVEQEGMVFEAERVG